MPDFEIKMATPHYLADLLPLVRAYHDFEEIRMSDTQRLEAIRPLLANDALGRIWLIRAQREIIGYVAITFGYSIELQGRDAYVDEFFIRQPSRGSGLGAKVIAHIRSELAKYRVVALHLEVAKTNERTQRFYSSLGFTARDRYELMSVDIGADV